MNYDQIGLYAMAALYIFAGLMHFIRPKFYLPIMPPYLPNHKAMIFWSGVFEVALGAGLLFENRRSFSATGIILLLIAIFPANVYMARSEKFARIPAWLRWARLPLQAVLIWWAYQYV